MEQTLLYKTAQSQLNLLEDLHIYILNYNNQGNPQIVFRLVCIVSGAKTLARSDEKGQQLLLESLRQTDKEKYKEALAIGQSKIHTHFHTHSGANITKQFLLRRDRSQVDSNNQNHYHSILLHLRASQRNIALINQDYHFFGDRLDFTHNDELAQYLGKRLGAEKTFFITESGGLFSDFGKTSQTLITTVDRGFDTRTLDFKENSDGGTGGMSEKVKSARLLQKDGLDSVITGLDQLARLYDHMYRNEGITGTHFLSRRLTKEQNREYCFERRRDLIH